MTIIVLHPSTINVFTRIGKRTSFELPKLSHALLECLARADGQVVPWNEVFRRVYERYPDELKPCLNPDRRRLSGLVHETRRRIEGGPVEIIGHGASGYSIGPDIEPHFGPGLDLAQQFAQTARAGRNVLLQLSSAIVDQHLAGNSEAARKLGREFAAHASESAVASVSNPALHRLLLVGLPVAPDHCMAPPIDFLAGRAELLLDEGNLGRLLCGVRLTELSYAAAYDYLHEPAGENCQRCARFHYVLGQTARKQEEFAVADFSFEDSVAAMKAWPGTECSCAPRCKKADLLLHALRGRAVVARALKEYERADEYFENATEFVSGASSVNRADFWHSYGYLKFEQTFLDPTGVLDATAFDKAKECFAKATEAHREWVAPVLRTAVLCLAEQARSDAYKHFVRVWTLANGARRAEERLTATNAAFALALLEPATDWGNRAAGCLKVAFSTEIVPSSVRRCHSFDNTVINRFVKTEDGGVLARIAKLFREAPSWNARSVAEQIALVSALLP